MTDALQQLIAHWIPQEIRELQAYHVADARGLVKLDAMENPYTWPDELRDEWLEILAATDVNRYPDPVATDVRDALKRSLNLPAGMELMLGNGSDEIIQIIAMALTGPASITSPTRCSGFGWTVAVTSL